MFNPYDESCHAGTLTGMTQRAIGLAGPANAKLGQIVQQPEVREKVTQEELTAYMAKPFAVPAATDAPKQRTLFANAVALAEKSPYVQKLRQFLRTPEAAFGGYLEAAKKEEAKAKATIDNYEKDLAAAESALDVVMQPLVEESAKLDAEFLNFIDWIQSSVKEIAEFGSGSDDNFAEKLWESGALDMGRGQDALFQCAIALYHKWEEAPYAGSGPPLQMLPAANPPLIYKGKAVTGVEPVVVWNKTTQKAESRPDIGYMYVKWTSFSVQEKGYSVQQKWQFGPDVTGAPTRLKSLGPTAKASGVAGGYMAANRWNNGVFPRVQKMAALWPAVPAAQAKVQAVKTAYAKAVKDLAAAQQALAEIPSPEKQMQSLVNSIPDGFLRGYADVLTKVEGLVGKALAGADRATNKTTVPNFEKLKQILSDAIASVQKSYTEGLAQEDAGLKAKILMGALALIDNTKKQLEASKVTMDAYEQDTIARLETIKQIEGFKIPIDPKGTKGSMLFKYKKSLLEDLANTQKIRDGVAKINELATAVQEKVKSKAEEALANVGVKEPPKETTPPPPPPAPEKSSAAVPLALSIIGIAAALRG